MSRTAGKSPPGIFGSFHRYFRFLVLWKHIRNPSNDSIRLLRERISSRRRDIVVSAGSGGGLNSSSFGCGCYR